MIYSGVKPYCGSNARDVLKPNEYKIPIIGKIVTCPLNINCNGLVPKLAASASPSKMALGARETYYYDDDYWHYEFTAVATQSVVLDISNACSTEVLLCNKNEIWEETIDLDRCPWYDPTARSAPGGTRTRGARARRRPPARAYASMLQVRLPYLKRRRWQTWETLSRPDLDFLLSLTWFPVDCCSLLQAISNME